MPKNQNFFHDGVTWSQRKNLISFSIKILINSSQFSPKIKIEPIPARSSCVSYFGIVRVSFCAPGSGPTLQQCHKTSRIFAENERILRVATEVASFFIGLFSKEKDLWLFGRAPSASQKALPKSQKGPFSRKRTVKMMPPPTLGKSARSREYP